MQSIKYTPECIEPDSGSRLAVQHRLQVLQHSDTRSGLGPVDLVSVLKCATGTFSDSEAYFFHHVLGRDITSTASAAAYFADLCQVEQVGLVAGLFITEQWKVTDCMYCCFDAFSRCDIRCNMTLPGGVKAVALDCRGKQRVVTPLMWKQVAVSAFVRSELYHPGALADVPALSCFQAIQTPNLAEELQSAVLTLYESGAAQQALSIMGNELRGGALPEDTDIILAAFLAHFRRRQCWDSALDFFAHLTKVHPPAIVYCCVAMREMGQPLESLTALRNYALHHKNCVSITLALACDEIDHGNTEDAITLCRHAILNAAHLHAPWLCFAKALARCSLFDFALLALNSMPPADPKISVKQAAFPAGLPQYVSVTTPLSPSYNPDLHEARVIADERKWPAAHVLTVPRERWLLPEDIHTNTASLQLVPYGITAYLHASAHHLLLDIIKELGWTEFLHLRAHMFRMDTEDFVQRQSNTPSSSSSNNEFDEYLQTDHVAHRPADTPDPLQLPKVQPAMTVPQSCQQVQADSETARPVNSSDNASGSGSMQIQDQAMPVPSPSREVAQGEILPLRKSTRKDSRVSKTLQEHKARKTSDSEQPTRHQQAVSSTYRRSTSPQISPLTQDSIPASSSLQSSLWTAVFGSTNTVADTLQSDDGASDPTASSQSPTENTRYIPHHVDNVEGGPIGESRSSPCPVLAHSPWKAAGGHGTPTQQDTDSLPHRSSIRDPPPARRPSELSSTVNRLSRPAHRSRPAMCHEHGRAHCTQDAAFEIPAPGAAVQSDAHRPEHTGAFENRFFSNQQHADTMHRPSCLEASSRTNEAGCSLLDSQGHGTSAGSIPTSSAPLQSHATHEPAFETRSHEHVHQCQRCSEPVAETPLRRDSEKNRVYGHAHTSSAQQAAHVLHGALQQKSPGKIELRALAHLQLSAQHLAAGLPTHQHGHYYTHSDMGSSEAGGSGQFVHAYSADVDDIPKGAGMGAQCARCRAAALSQRAGSTVIWKQHGGVHRNEPVDPSVAAAQSLDRLPMGGLRDMYRDDGASVLWRSSRNGAVRQMGRVADKLVSELWLQTEIDANEAAANIGGVDVGDAMLAKIGLLRLDPSIVQKAHMIAPWLDAVVTLLYIDLREYVEWRCIDAGMLLSHDYSSVGKLLSEPDNEIQRDSSEWIDLLVCEQLKLRPEPQAINATEGDWLVRGAASERLLQFTDAVQAYRCALHLKVSTTACLGLARLYSFGGMCGEVLQTLTVLMLDADNKHQWSEHRKFSLQMVAVMSTLIAVAGMSQVQRHLETGTGQIHPALEILVESMFEWGTDGCDC